MVPSDSHASTPRPVPGAAADRLYDKLEVGQAAHQKATPVPGDEAAVQHRCGALVLVGADQAPELLLEADCGFRDGDLDVGVRR